MSCKCTKLKHSSAYRNYQSKGLGVQTATHLVSCSRLYFTRIQCHSDFGFLHQAPQSTAQVSPPSGHCAQQVTILFRAASSIQTKHRKWKVFLRLTQCLSWLSWELAWSQQLSAGAVTYGLQNQAAIHRSILGQPLIHQLCRCPTQLATIFSLLIQGTSCSKDPGKPEI